MAALRPITQAITKMKGIEEFIGYVMGLTHFKTTIDTTSRAGISISYKMRGD